MNLAPLAYAAWLWSARGADRRLARALREPQRAQHGVLQSLLRANASSRIGQRLGFDHIDSVDSWRRAVPLTSSEDLEQDLAAIRAGAAAVLTTEPITRLVPTSGSSGAFKLIPWTRSLERAFQAGIGPWICDLLRRFPDLRGGPAYWSVSPAFDLPSSDAVVSIGFDSDARYLGAWIEPLVSAALVAPSGLRASRSMAGFQYATLLLLLAEPQLRLISVWHPSFFTTLWQQRAVWWEQLLDDLACGSLSPPEALGDEAEAAVRRRLRPQPRRARELGALGSASAPLEVWPRLGVVSAWTDGPAAGPAAQLAKLVAPARLEPKGLLATEAVVSLPYRGHTPLALTSHYLEFLDSEGHCFEAHELQVGAHYEVVVTTQGGLYRYRLGDQIEVTGLLEATPSVRFLGRADARVDLVGEKLSEAFVAAALNECLGAQSGAFAVLAVDAEQVPGEPPRYTLLIDSTLVQPAPILQRLEEALRRNPHYRYARDLGQLGALQAYQVADNATGRWLGLEGAGRQLGAVKPSVLSARRDWRQSLPGQYLDFNLLDFDQRTKRANS